MLYLNNIGVRNTPNHSSWKSAVSTYVRTTYIDSWNWGGTSFSVKSRRLLNNKQNLEDCMITFFIISATLKLKPNRALNSTNGIVTDTLCSWSQWNHYLQYSSVSLRYHIQSIPSLLSEVSPCEERFQNKRWKLLYLKIIPRIKERENTKDKIELWQKLYGFKNEHS